MPAQSVAPSERLIRAALWSAVALNASGTALFGAHAVGVDTGLLPVTAPRYYMAMLAWTVALFGALYVWLLRQPAIDRRFVTLAGAGKLGFFLVAVLYGVLGEIPARAVLNMLPDGVLGTLFLWWAARAQTA
ncbi:MAG: hypothetical protein MUF00_00565 [Gemmatimonadaceae bacterium]|jgi:hypothetical protein|nr:hypothetical protein [Gemmatimonadaceae bacterium]